jgi:hypothetical protein
MAASASTEVAATSFVRAIYDGDSAARLVLSQATKAKILGEEWSVVPVGTEVWSTVTVGSEVWAQQPITSSTSWATQ